jgi:glycosidase
MPNRDHLREHISHPLTREALVKAKQSPDYNYLHISNARLLSSKLQVLPVSFSPGEISAIGLLGKVYLHLLESYQDNYYPRLSEDLDLFLDSQLGSHLYETTIKVILSCFPTPSLYQKSASLSTYSLSVDGTKEKRLALHKSVILILLAEANPAIRKADGLFTTTELRTSSQYQPLLTTLEAFFDTQPESFSTGESLFNMLRSPSRIHPNSIHKQLTYIIQNWESILGEAFLKDLLVSRDRLKEEQINHWFGPGTPENPLGFELDSSQANPDIVQFSKDLFWMPRVILIAKNAFVWMDQLSIKYQRSISNLDQIPDQELEQLSAWGITSLWLIGIWQRSQASQTIKQLCGNMDAVPSAYSLFDYTIADAVGGESAFENLSARAQTFNIRLAADMVPNHMGITSNWIFEHPDRFISLSQIPFPSYSFNSPDLSNDSRVSIYLEEHYIDKSDASVVFKRVDNSTGEVRFIYHGNDGTAMPWNDTAQLDFLQETVRESVIQTILHVARKFPIIRFDAAMTLAKKHYQRLWFPQPGTGGDIPTRSDFGLSESQFNELMPFEFWREVVDRVAAEAPNTLLLAEAFWMMEGYFVRTLGMHRVYNSAFMHMLRDEDNNKYRDLIKQTLSFDPEILKRYVNFMSNPDEETAIAQFGSDDKYFGICIMMATLPGLPMFGHGQIEGYSEKYGMEYQRAHYDEQPNKSLIDRHHREIFPLLHKRYLFAEVANFVFYDFITDSGSINENVFAYSNRSNDETALILYQNKWGTAQGSIKRSAEINGGSIDLLSGLGLNNPDSSFVIFRESISNLEFIHSKKELQDSGLNLNLCGYQYKVFLDIREVPDPEGYYSRLNIKLSGSGVPDIQEKLTEFKLSPILEPLDNLFYCAFQEFISPYLSSTSMLRKLEFTNQSDVEIAFSQCLIAFTDALLDVFPTFPGIPNERVNLIPSKLSAIHRFLDIYPLTEPYYNNLVVTLLLWGLLSEIGGKIPDNITRKLIFLLSTMPFTSQMLSNLDEDLIISSTDLLLHPLILINELNLDSNDLSQFWFSNELIQSYLDVHEFEDNIWFNKEAFEFLVGISLGLLYLNSQIKSKEHKISGFDRSLSGLHQEILDALKESEYQVNIYLSVISKESTPLSE